MILVTRGGLASTGAAFGAAVLLGDVALVGALLAMSTHFHLFVLQCTIMIKAASVKVKLCSAQ